MTAQVEVLSEHVVVECAIPDMSHPQLEQTRFQDAFVIPISGVGVTHMRVHAPKIDESISRAGRFRVRRYGRAL